MTYQILVTDGALDRSHSELNFNLIKFGPKAITPDYCYFDNPSEGFYEAPHLNWAIKKSHRWRAFCNLQFLCVSRIEKKKHFM